MTGKGERWGRDRLGRSAPAFIAASTTALPPRLTTRQADVVCGCCFAARPANCWLFVLRPVQGGESAGCVRLQWLCSAGCVFLPCHLCHAMPTALLMFLPPFCSFCLPLFISMCARIIIKPTCLQAARLSCWQLQHGPAVAARAPVLTFSFPAESMILGHGVV